MFIKYTKPVLRTMKVCSLQCSTGSSASVDSSCDVGPDIALFATCADGSVPFGPFLNGCNAGGAAQTCNTGNGVLTGCGTGNVAT
jgi:hypothetical protein